ncbi:peptide chain release factor N(5)-glutamine methyltransferase [Holophaga foetida]|uniref:peptide chain release factor N(5)-glutamine methyltransferase n=1 Tax=Holophaga foetida TaxID=35839 RepID=UPI0002474D11|nr:peptide chain release factor N(5)-glutamine methyltransferase [Holophaga foetida]
MFTYSDLRQSLRASLAAFLSPEEAAAEAALWFSEGLGREASWFHAHGMEPVPDGERHQIGGWLERRQKGEPWAYILGWSLWRGRRFETGPATLIPRPETELVLEAALEVGKRLGVRHAVDIGTGTGILGITMALETDWAITATDISEKALAVAQRNALALGAKLSFRPGDLLGPVPNPVGLVVSNPPYVDPADRPGLQRELSFEPETALFAPDRGLALTTELLKQARVRSAPGCVLEIGSGQGDELSTRARVMGWKRVMIHRDFAGHDRVLVVC